MALERIGPSGVAEVERRGSVGGGRRTAQDAKSPMNTGFSSAPKRTRTSTGHTAHKALNPVARVCDSSDMTLHRKILSPARTARTGLAGRLLPRLLPPGGLEIVGRASGSRWPEVIVGRCGHPAECRTRDLRRRLS